MHYFSSFCSKHRLWVQKVLCWNHLSLRYRLRVHVRTVSIEYRKTPKFLDTQHVCCNQPKIQTKVFFRRQIYPKCADRMANSADTDHTAPLGAI